MSSLEDLTEVLQHIATTVGPVVVGIGHHRGTGSGIVVAEGRVLTNAHNVHAEAVTIRMSDGSRRDGTVAAADADGDLAVIAVDTTGVTPVEWDADARPQIGTPVFALSRSRSGAATRVTFGTVAAVDRGFRGPRNRPITGASSTAPARLRCSTSGSSAGAACTRGKAVAGAPTGGRCPRRAVPDPRAAGRRRGRSRS